MNDGEDQIRSALAEWLRLRLPHGVGGDEGEAGDGGEKEEGRRPHLAWQTTERMAPLLQIAL